MSTDKLYLDLQLVTVDDTTYLCVVVEPGEDKPAVRTKITYATKYLNDFSDTVDRWLCELNVGEHIKMTIGKNQGYTTRELQEDQLVIVEQKAEFMKVIRKLALARMYNSQYCKFIQKL